MITKLLIFISIGLTMNAVYAEEDYSKEVEKATRLTSNVYLIEGAGGNVTASIGSDGVLLVDDDFAPMAEKLAAKLKELKGGTPRFIINTHFHYDHTDGNKVFGPTSTIIAATEVRERLMHEQTLWHEQHPAFPESALPVLTYDQSLTLHWNADDVRILHLPHGHTDGDSVVFFVKDKVVSMGDLYFAGMFPIFHPEHDGSLNGLIQNITFVLKQSPDEAQFVPGHGAVTGKAELAHYLKMIEASRAIVRRALKAGRTLEQIQKQGLPREWETYSHGYLNTDKWLALLVKSEKPNGP